MSDGPIKQWRDGFKVARVSTAQSASIHGLSITLKGPYCGRKGEFTPAWSDVSCADCHAARRADGGC